MRKCNHCGHILTIESPFCPFCGKEIKEAPKSGTCPKCGMKDIPRVASFCPNCGERLREMLVCPICGNEMNKSHQQTRQTTYQQTRQTTYQQTRQTTYQQARQTAYQQTQQDTGQKPRQETPRKPPLVLPPISKIQERNGLHIGDFFYSDGTVSSARIASKEPVGVVFSLNTTEAEKSRGWTNGHIISLRNVKAKVMRKYLLLGESLEETEHLHWKRGSDNQQMLFPGSDKQNVMDAVADRNGFLYFYNPATQDKNMEAFEAIRQYNRQRPLPRSTSGWYLPSIGQLFEFMMNLGKVSPLSFEYTDNPQKPNGELLAKEQYGFFKSQMMRYGFSDISFMLSSSECGAKQYWRLDNVGRDLVVKCGEKHSSLVVNKVFPVAAI